MRFLKIAVFLMLPFTIFAQQSFNSQYKLKSIVKEIQYKLDVNSLQKQFAPGAVGLNDIVRATIKTASPIPYDAYTDLRVNGGAILIDETSNVTVGACMIQ